MRALVFFFLLTSGAVAHAQRASLKVSPERFANVPFTLQVEAEGLSQATAPTPPQVNIPGYEVTYEGPRQRVVQRGNQVSMSIAFLYAVKGPAGAMRVPAIEIATNGGTIKTAAKQFQVKPVPKTDKIRVALDLPDKPVWVGQSFSVGLTISIRRGLEINGIELEMPLAKMSGVVSLKSKAAVASPGVSTLSAHGLTLHAERKRRQGWVDFEMEIDATVLKAGEHVISPTGVTAEVRMGTVRGPAGFPQARYVARAAFDQERKLIVKNLPAAGKPSHFTGAIGANYNIKVSADRTVLRVGEPIALSIDITGVGPLETIRPPELTKTLDDKQFRVLDVTAGQDIKDGKRFVATVEVLTNQVSLIPEIPYSFFDPANERYGETKSTGISLSVEGAKVVGSGQVVDLTSRPQSSEKSNVVSLDGVDLALSNSGVTLASAAQDSPWLLWLVYLGGGALMLASLIVARVRRKSQANEPIAIAQRKLKEALQKAVEQPAKEAASPLASALRNVAATVGERASVEELATQVEDCGYAPDTREASIPSHLLDQVRAVAKRLPKKRGATVAPAVAASVFFVSFTAVAAPAKTDLKEARETYAAAMNSEAPATRVARFTKAARAFEQISQAQPRRPALLTDIGNAWIGAKQLGKARLAYEKALVVDHDHGQARRNASWINSQLPEWVRPKRQQQTSVAFWSMLPKAQRHRLALLGYAAMVIAISTWLLIGRKRWTIPLLVTGTLTWLVLFGSAMQKSPQKERAVVIATDIIRQADNPQSRPAWSEPLPAGAVVTVTGKRPQWVRVSIGRAQGWVPEQAVASIPQAVDSD